MKIVKEAESFNPAPIIGIIREFLQEHPFENEAHDTFEDFEEYVAYELFDKEVKELTSEESYAISDVWEDLQDKLREEFLDSAVKDDLSKVENIVQTNKIEDSTDEDYTNSTYTNGNYTLKILNKVKPGEYGVNNAYNVEWNGNKQKLSAKGISMVIRHNKMHKISDSAIKDSAVNDSERYLIRKNSGAGEVVYETNDLQDAIEELRALGKSYYIDDTQKDITIKYSQAIRDAKDINEAYEKEMIGGDKVQSGNAGKMIQTLLTVADQEALIEKAYNASDDKKETMIKIFADNSFDEDDVNDFIYLLEYGDSKAYFYLDTLVRDRIIDAIVEVLGEVDLNEDYKSAKRIVADIYDKSGNILETRYFSNRKQLDSFVNNLNNNLIDMTADNNVPFKDSKGNMRICDIWRITVDDLITEGAKKKKELGAFVKLDAGDVEEGNKFFNKAVAGTESESGCNMSEDLRTINIRDELNKLDTIDYNDLVNMYDCLKLSDLEKTQLAQLLANHDNKNAIKFISDRYYKENICEQAEDEYGDAPNTLLSKRDRLSKRLSEIDQERAKIEKTIDYQQDHNYSMIDFDLMDRLDELNMEAEIINKKLEEI